MKPPPFEYRRPETVEEALDLLAEHGSEAKVLAGGQSLVPMLNLRLARPALLVDINLLPLQSVTVGDGVLRLGATVRQHRIVEDREISDGLPVLAHATRFVAHPAIRNRGTLGGSLAHADPAAELALIAVLNEATLVVVSSAGERRIDSERFFRGTFTTTLNEDELLTSIEFRAVQGVTSFGFAEAAERYGDFAIAAAAVQAVWVDGVVTEARVAVSGGADVPLRLPAIEALIKESTADSAPRVADDAKAVAVEAVDPLGDIHATAAYRRSLIGELVSRAASRALSVPGR